VHRDVSPQNVLVGVDGVPRVLDFGIAKTVGRLQTTRAGQIKGKMAYLAPEHVRGGPIDRRTDIYGAAVVLWEALTGVQLFDGENDAIVLARVLAGQVPAPSAFARNIGRSLEAITMRGLEREPEGRFDTAREMALALQQDVGLVAPNEVGDWVSELASEPLAARSRYLTELEQLSARDKQRVQTLGMKPPSPPAPAVPWRNETDDGPSTRPIAPPGEVAETAALERARENAGEVDGSAHPLVSVVEGGPRSSSAPLSTRRRRNARVGLLAAALAVVIGLLAARTATSNDPQVTAVDRPLVLVTPPPEIPAPTRMAAASAAAISEEPLSPRAAPSEHRTATPAPANATRPTARAAFPSIEGGRGPSIARPAFGQSNMARASNVVATPAGSATPARRGCRPPYVIDTAGIKRFKVECL
jgi:serine/threonine-protein kinase